MPTIIDPDNLLDSLVDSGGQNVYIDPANRTIKIRNNSAAPIGPSLDNTGVTLQALYSFLKQEWKDDPKGKDLIAYPFPLIAITPEQFEFRYGWAPADDSSRNLLRTGGWREYAVDNSTLKREYMGVISLGNIDGDQTGTIGDADQDVVYYGFFNPANGTSVAGPLDFNFPGEVNQAVQTLDSAAYDYRTSILRLFVREEGKTYNQQDTTQIGITAGSTLPYNTQRFPLVEGQDINATVSDATIVANKGTGGKYNQGTGPSIEYLATSELSDTFGYSQDIFGGPKLFGIKINAVDGTDGTSSLTNQEIYSWVQYSLRQDSDIEAGAGSIKNGKLADELLAFVGNTLTTKLATNLDQSGTKTGVAILNINTADINNTQLRSDSDILYSFPFSSGVTINFSQEILDDSANAKVFVYYDYTRSYTGTSITVSKVGTANSDALQDSAEFTLAGFSVTPVNSTQNPEGLNPAVQADAYFRVVGASTSPGNNTIWKITNLRDSSSFAAITLDNDPSPGNEIISGGSIRNHPINSPGAVLIDSAGAASENSSKGLPLTTTYLNASNQLTFSYAYDGNTQKDRLAGTDVAVNIRAIGLNNGSWVEQTGTIREQNDNAFSVVSAVERNYNDPV